MDYQEQFFKEQLKKIQEARNAKEGRFDKLQEEECRRVDQSYSAVDPQKRYFKPMPLIFSIYVIINHGFCMSGMNVGVIV